MARGQTANLASGNLGDRDIVSHDSYRLCHVQIDTLKPLAPPCSEVIDAFFSLLNDDDIHFMPTSFFYNLVSKPLEKMLSWALSSETLVQVRRLAIPLHSHVRCHWSLALVKRDEHFIEIYDSLRTAQYFMPTHPTLIKWANSLRGLPGAGNWNACYRISERKDICIEKDFGVDAPVYKMAHGYNIANYSERDGVYPPNIRKLRKEMQDSIINN